MVLVLVLGSAFRADLGSGRVAAPGDRQRSSTAVSSEVKVRARRAPRVHTNTHTRARSPLSTHFPPPPALRRAITLHQPLQPLPRTHPSAPATDHEAPRLPDAWTSAANERRPSPAGGRLALRDIPPRRAAPAASRESARS